MITTSSHDEPAIVRLSKEFASRLEEEASEWPESATPLACRLVETASITAEELERAHWSGRRAVLRDALSRGLDAMGNTEQMLDRAKAEYLVTAEKHSKLEARVCQLQGLLRYLV